MIGCAARHSVSTNRASSSTPAASAPIV
ncbi:MAG: hypothetical protein QOJ30_3338, partial [Pseudonocardiales bacterium]|nr:hypothetical protein [Pseudonocardiales bacterium]